MSTTHQPAKNRPVTTDDDAWPDRDAYAIEIPDAFKQAYPQADSVIEALRLAEDAPSTTDPAEFAACPRCDSQRLSPKGNDSQTTKKADGYVCENCRTHVSDPEHPERGEIVFSDAQVSLARWGNE